MPDWTAETPLRVVTGYHSIAARFFARHAFPHVALLSADGALEAAPLMGSADIILDLVRPAPARSQHCRHDRLDRLDLLLGIGLQVQPPGAPSRRRASCQHPCALQQAAAAAAESARARAAGVRRAPRGAAGAPAAGPATPAGGRAPSALRMRRCQGRQYPMLPPPLSLAGITAHRCPRASRCARTT